MTVSAFLTDERLRTWLDGNQPQRERLCIGLLAIDRRYAQITPRRPKGGPDGGRDLEAVFVGGAQVWGAVGFRNQVNDSPADKRWVKNKFIHDLAEARKRNPKLDHFVFFTNIDLTPAETLRLQQRAQTDGIVMCDIFSRERIRMLLDSPEGLALRYQYLAIEMSSAEQAAFFGRFGDALQQVLERRFDEIDRKLARIEFHNECLRPTRYVALDVQLKKALRSDEIPTIVLLAVAVAERKPEPNPTLCLTVVAGPHRIRPSHSACFKSDVAIWSGPPLKRVVGGGEIETFSAGDRLLLGLAIESIPGFTSVADFDMLWLHLYANRAVVRLARSVGLVVNGYVIARSNLEDLFFDPARPEDPWVRQCLDEVRGVKILECVDGPTSGVLLPPFVYTSFAGYFPTKIEKG